MTKCPSEVTLQALFDGELDHETAAKTMAHVSSCQNCARVITTTENENHLLIEALQLEFAHPAPFERAYQQIQQAISSGETASVARADNSRQHQWWNPVSMLFSPSRAALAYAGLAVVIFSTILIATYLKRKAPTPIAQTGSQGPLSTASPAPTSEFVTSAPPKQVPELNGSRQPRELVSQKSANRTRGTISRPLPGEDEFQRQLAALVAGIESDTPMRPGLRVEYEQNLALLDEVIELTRNTARQNPDDAQAAHFMFAAYKGKIDFLKQVADAGRYQNQN